MDKFFLLPLFKGRVALCDLPDNVSHDPAISLHKAVSWSVTLCLILFYLIPCSTPFSQCSCFPGIVLPNKTLAEICFLQSLFSSRTFSANVYSKLFCTLTFVSRLAMSSNYSLHTHSSTS